MQPYTNNGIGTLPDLLPDDVVIKRAFVREDHGVIVWVVFLAGVLVLLLKRGGVGFFGLDGRRLMIFVCWDMSWGCIGHILFTLVVGRSLLLGLGYGDLLNLVSNARNWLSVVKVDPFYLLRR